MKTVTLEMPFSLSGKMFLRVKVADDATDEEVKSDHAVALAMRCQGVQAVALRHVMNQPDLDFVGGTEIAGVVHPQDTRAWRP